MLAWEFSAINEVFSFLRVCSESTHRSFISYKLSSVLLVIVFNYIWLSELCWHLCWEIFGFPLSSLQLVLIAEMMIKRYYSSNVSLGLSKDTFTVAAPHNNWSHTSCLGEPGSGRAALVLPFSASSSAVGATPPPHFLLWAFCAQRFCPSDGTGIKRQGTETEHLAFRQVGRKQGFCFPAPQLSPVGRNVSMVSRSSENETQAPASFPQDLSSEILKHLSSEVLKKE